LAEFFFGLFAVILKVVKANINISLVQFTWTTIEFVNRLYCINMFIFFFNSVKIEGVHEPLFIKFAINA